MSPYEVLFAKEPIILAEVMLSAPKAQNEKELDVYVKDLKSNAGVINDKVNKNLNNSHEIQKKYYDKSVRATRRFDVGDLILLVNERNISGESHAFKIRALGPFKIINIFNDFLN
jgi:hypothetical protein